jgi:lipase
MQLNTRSWNEASDKSVVCVHGLTQHGGVFEPLGRRMAENGYRVVSVDLRGHGRSDREPPWNTETHVGDLIETADALDITEATWIGHSFGGRMIAALAAHSSHRVSNLVLLDPGLEVSPSYALKSAEMDRLDWSFGTADGAVNALLSSDTVSAAPQDTVAAYVEEDLQRGGDGRLRFSFCPSAVVAAWSELALPPPTIASVPTLLVRPVISPIHTRADDIRYRAALGPMLTMAAVPNGHNVLWESLAETEAAIQSFLKKEEAET